MDLEKLLAPITPDLPTGLPLDPNLSDSNFARLQHAFEEAAEAERRRTISGAEEEGFERPRPANWKVVVQLAEEILANESKDLRVASFLARGLLHTRQFAGLHAGLRLIDQLCQRYWNDIHPAPTKADGHEHAVRQFKSLAVRSSLDYLSQIPISGPKGEQTLTYADYVLTKKLEETADATKRQPMIQLGILTFDEFQENARKAPAEFRRDLRSDLEGALSCLSGISDFFDANCQPDEDDESTVPDMYELRILLNEILDAVCMLFKDESSEVASSHVDPADAGASQPMSQNSTSTNEMTRNQAFEQLRQVADFFEKSEPHSPIPIVLRELTKWRKLSLTELLARGDTSLSSILSNIFNNVENDK